MTHSAAVIVAFCWNAFTLWLNKIDSRKMVFAFWNISYLVCARLAVDCVFDIENRNEKNYLSLKSSTTLMLCSEKRCECIKCQPNTHTTTTSNYKTNIRIPFSNIQFGIVGSFMYFNPVYNPYLVSLDR